MKNYIFILTIVSMIDGNIFYSDSLTFRFHNTAIDAFFKRINGMNVKTRQAHFSSDFFNPANVWSMTVIGHSDSYGQDKTTIVTLTRQYM